MQPNSEQTIEDMLKGSMPQAAPGATQRADFEHRFEAELRRLDAAGRELDAWEEENLLSALGAAGIGEYELACAFVEAVRRPPSLPPQVRRDFRRLPMSVATVRRRFERRKASPANPDSDSHALFR